MVTAEIFQAICGRDGIFNGISSLHSHDTDKQPRDSYVHKATQPWLRMRFVFFLEEEHFSIGSEPLLWDLTSGLDHVSKKPIEKPYLNLTNVSSRLSGKKKSLRGYHSVTFP